MHYICFRYPNIYSLILAQSRLRVFTIPRDFFFNVWNGLKSTPLISLKNFFFLFFYFHISRPFRYFFAVGVEQCPAHLPCQCKIQYPQRISRAPLLIEHSFHYSIRIISFYYKNNILCAFCQQIFFLSPSPRRSGFSKAEYSSLLIVKGQI